MIASERGHVTIVKKLLKHGVDINEEVPGQGTALHIASEKGQLDVLKELLKHGIDVNCQTKLKSKLPDVLEYENNSDRH